MEKVERPACTAPSSIFRTVMELVEPVTLDEVVDLWLANEIRSPRFGSRLRALLDGDGQPLSIVEAPELDDPDACRYRRQLLGEFRAFGLPRQPKPNYLDGFQVGQLEWRRVMIGPDDVARMLFIDWDYWGRSDGRDPIGHHPRSLQAGRL